MLSKRIRRLMLATAVASVAAGLFVVPSANATAIWYASPQLAPDTWYNAGAYTTIRGQTYSQYYPSDANIVGTREIRVSDGAILYRVIASGLADSGFHAANTRRPSCANGGGYTAVVHCYTYIPSSPAASGSPQAAVTANAANDTRLKEQALGPAIRPWGGASQA